ncbi:MAG: sigma-70 family RNA polymerase sigma factor [Planctomycetaceae bacterium]|nr:sigma-70 family RNA polymerase sigma factor [Planctomycetaceae bacterium]
MVESDSTTNSTLLAKLRGESTASRSWDEFVARYGPRIVNWCQKWGLQPADAADVTQNVLLELSQQMRTFRYDPDKRFRSWLKTVTRRAWYDYSQRRKKLGPVPSTRLPGWRWTPSTHRRICVAGWMKNVSERCWRSLWDACDLVSPNTPGVPLI